jgi:hypothetical protein
MQQPPCEAAVMAAAGHAQSKHRQQESIHKAAVWDARQQLSLEHWTSCCSWTAYEWTLLLEGLSHPKG